MFWYEQDRLSALRYLREHRGEVFASYSPQGVTLTIVWPGAPMTVYTEWCGPNWREEGGVSWEIFAAAMLWRAVSEHKDQKVKRMSERKRDRRRTYLRPRPGRLKRAA